jgi:hypothetical protein
MAMTVNFIDLESFAREAITADHFPDDHHLFSLFSCEKCGVVPFELTIQHDTGSLERNFKGIIRGQCEKCGNIRQLFTFTGEHRQPLREEHPVCECKNPLFYTGECERIEGSQGLEGFFDEGIIVGKCSHCEANRVLVYTD